jgi:hypothetical protein
MLLQYRLVITLFYERSFAIMNVRVWVSVIIDQVRSGSIRFGLYRSRSFIIDQDRSLSIRIVHFFIFINIKKIDFLFFLNFKLNVNKINFSICVNCL